MKKIIPLLLLAAVIIPAAIGIRYAAWNLESRFWNYIFPPAAAGLTAADTVPAPLSTEIPIPAIRQACATIIKAGETDERYYYCADHAEDDDLSRLGEEEIALWNLRESCMAILTTQPNYMQAQAYKKCREVVDMIDDPPSGMQ